MSWSGCLLFIARLVDTIVLPTIGKNDCRWAIMCCNTSMPWFCCSRMLLYCFSHSRLGSGCHNVRSSNFWCSVKHMLGQQFKRSLFLVQLILGLWACSQSVPNNKSWFPVLVTAASMVSLWQVPISIHKMAAWHITPCLFNVPSTFLA